MVSIGRVLFLALTVFSLNIYAVKDGAPVGQELRAIVSVEKRNNQSICTGFAVHPRIVITAAHCTSFNLETVRLGNLSKRGDSDNSISILRVYKHDSYVDKSSITTEKARETVDLAVLLLNKELPFGEDEYIVPIDLREFQGVPSSILAVGFGGASDIESQKSSAFLSNIQSFNTFPQGNTVAYKGNLVPGDSGGPALVSLPNGRMGAIGVASTLKTKSRIVTYSLLANGLAWMEKQIGYNPQKTTRENYYELLCRAVADSSWGQESIQSLVADLKRSGGSIENFGCANHSGLLVDEIKKLEQLHKQRQAERAIKSSTYEKAIAYGDNHNQAFMIALKDLQGVFSDYDYFKLRDLGISYEQALEVLLLESTRKISLYDYIRVKEKGGTHYEAKIASLEETAGNISTFDYLKVREAGANHEEALMVARAGKKQGLSIYDYERARGVGLSHKDALAKSLQSK